MPSKTGTAEWKKANRSKMNAGMRIYRMRRRRILDAIKTQSGCMDCGYNNPKYPGTLEFDHVRGNKDFTIGHVISKMMPLETLMAEIEKCDIVCSICHRIRTTDREPNVYSKFL